MISGIAQGTARHGRFHRAWARCLPGWLRMLRSRLEPMWGCARWAFCLRSPSWRLIPQLSLAAAYRTGYGVVSYLAARLAPNRPMEHALLGGAIGMALGIVGAVVTWNRGLGPHWYSVALIVTALPKRVAGWQASGIADAERERTN